MDQRETGPSTPAAPERAAGGALAPLSYNQQGPWYLYRLLPGNATYNQGIALRLRGELDEARLAQACQTLVDRHASLRTSFVVEDGKPGQRAAAGAALSFEVVDAAGWTPQRLHERVVAEIHVPFDLARPPLVRGFLFRLSAAERVLLLVIHHIAADGWSIRTVLLPELDEIYSAGRRGQAAALPPLKAEYPDFVSWQRETVAGPAGEKHWAYWREKLSGELSPLNLPTDRPRPSVQSYNGAAHSFRLEAELVQELTTAAQNEGVTLPAFLMAAFQALLFRYTGQQDLIVGMLMAGRTNPKFDKVVGDFFNSVPIRTTPAGATAFKDYLQDVYQRLLGALEHQDYPFPLMVEKLNVGRDASRSPIFQVGFVYRRFPPAPRREPSDLSFEGIDIPEEQEGHFDVNLIVQQLDPADKSLIVHLKFNRDLFDRATIERMAGHFKTLLAGAAKDPAATLADLPLLTEAERRRILVEWNATERAYRLDDCLHRLIEEQARRAPEAPAVSFAEERLTYRELDERANRLARHLGTLGVGPEVFVGVCMERSLEMVVALLAVLKAGGAYVPMDPEYPQDRLAFMLEDSKVPVLLTQERLAERLPAHGAKVVRVDAIADVLAACDPQAPASGARAENAIYMIYTSGSTGKPKGAINHHRGVVNRLLWMQEEYRLTSADRVLQKTPFSFDVAGWEFWWPLLAGAELVMAKPGGHKDTSYLASVIHERGITTLHFVPSMLRLFLAESRLDLCGGLKRVMCSGEALPLDLQTLFFARLPGVELHNLYGPTEAAIDVTYWACRKEDGPQVSVPIGRPIANTQMYILDGGMRPVPIGVPGELYIGGVNVGRGYLNRDALTAERFIADPFSGKPGARLYKTGDLGRWRADGAIDYIGRNDFQVKIRGFRIELGEIEAAIGQQPGVKESLVVPVDEPGGGKALLAYAVLDEPGSASVDGLRLALKRVLPEYMVPARFVFLERFPLSPNGKIDRHALPKPSTERPALSAGLALPKTEPELKVAGVWKEVLVVDRVGLDDNFFDLGGHSLLLAQAHARLQTVFQREFPFVELFRHPTIRALASFLDGTQADGQAQAEEPARQRRIVQRRRA